jgi:hypothetical protein
MRSISAVSLRISGGSRTEQVAHALLVLHVHVEIAEQDDAPLGADALAPAGELARLHDVDAGVLVEGHAGHLIGADHVVLADEPALSGRHVDKHAGDRRFSARDQIRVRRDLLK